MVCRIVAVERDESTDEAWSKRWKDYVAKTNPGPGLANFTRPSWGLIRHPHEPDPEFALSSRWLLIGHPHEPDPEEE